MKATRLLEPASSQSICFFCACRLQNPAVPRLARVPRRSFVRTAWPRQHAGQAAAGSSFPDPDLLQPTPQPTPPPNLSQAQHSQRQNRFVVRGSTDDGETRSPVIRFAKVGSENEDQAGDPPQWGHLRRRQRDTGNQRGGDGSHEAARPTPVRKFVSLGTPSVPENVALQQPERQTPQSTSWYSIESENSGARRHHRDINPSAARRTQRGPIRFLQSETTLENRSDVRSSDFPRGDFEAGTMPRGDFEKRTMPRGDFEKKTMPRRDFEVDGNQVSDRQPQRGRNETNYQNWRKPLGSVEKDQTWQNFKPREDKPSDRQPLRNRNETLVDEQPRQYAAQETYDATPRRRSKEHQLSGASRRAEKFDVSGDAERNEELNAKAQKELKKQRRREKAEAAREAQEKTIELPAFISVANLATALKMRVESFTKKLEELGFEDVANDHVLNFENASLVAMEYNYQPTVDRSDIEDLKARPEPADASSLLPRPPVVTIMGHVDHGKTTLLDFLRKSSVAAQEHGGITQHIGAFSVSMPSGKLITFLDTPGHAAFLSMRQRGANVTDIVILVVAADDSVKPQTIEAIKHAKAARVPIIVAINKIDKDEANIERVKQDLLRHEIEVEDFGGDVQAYPVSGKTGEGLDDLVEAMVTQAEMLDMRAEIDGPAEGWVLEATTKKAGRIATVLVKRGTLRIGDIIVAGTTWARVRTLKNEAGIQVDEASPGMPVEVDGWRDQPAAGDEVLQAPSEQKASSVVDYRNSRLEQTQAAIDMEAINESRRIEMERRQREKEERQASVENDAKKIPPSQSATKNTETETEANTELFFIIKADVSGSAEAIEGSISALPLSNHPVNLNILRAAVGPVSEFDIDHASAVPSGHGFIVSFNQQVPPQMSGEAEKAGVRILDENIIYKVTDAIRGIVESKLPPIITKRVLGEAEMAQVFEINTGGRKFTKVAGCRVRNGVISKNKKIRVYRGSVGDDQSLVYDGMLKTLKSQKKDVPEMRKGTECGMGFDNWESFQPGDVIQSYEEKSEPRRLM